MAPAARQWLAHAALGLQLTSWPRAALGDQGGPAAACNEGRRPAAPTAPAGQGMPLLLLHDRGCTPAGAGLHAGGVQHDAHLAALQREQAGAGARACGQGGGGCKGGGMSCS